MWCLWQSYPDRLESCMCDYVLQTAASLSVQSRSAGAPDFAWVHAKSVGELIAFRFSLQISWSLGLCMRACKSCGRVDRFFSHSMTVYASSFEVASDDISSKLFCQLCGVSGSHIQIVWSLACLIPFCKLPLSCQLSPDQLEPRTLHACMQILWAS